MRVTANQFVQTPKSRHHLTSAVVGVIHLNGFAGRSGEWQLMLHADVDTSFESGLDFLECPNHKTAIHYGELAKWIAPGTKTCIERYNTVPDKNTDLFLDGNIPGKSFCVQSSLLIFSNDFMKGFQPLGSNLVRKNYHNVMEELTQQGKAMDLLCRIDGHKTSTGLKVYCTKSPQKDATLGKRLFKFLVGSSTSVAHIPEESSDIDTPPKKINPVSPNKDTK